MILIEHAAVEIAVPMWQLLLNGRFALLEDWCTFVQVSAYYYSNYIFCRKMAKQSLETLGICFTTLSQPSMPRSKTMMPTVRFHPYFIVIIMYY
jgi:hypothetical protein